MPLSQCSRTAAAAATGLCHERTSYSKWAVLGLGLLVILVLSSWFQTFASVSTTQTMGTATTTKCNIVPEHQNHKNKNHHDENDNDNDVFALASKQSLGFFDDISEAQWKVSQEIHFKSFPNHYAERVSKTSPKPNEWYAEHFQEEFHCAGARRLPSDSMNDGPKWVCDPHRISQQTDCLVYSFGCFGNIVFEKAVKEEIGSHCEIHTFDIVSQRAGMNYSSLLEAINVTFHHWGIGTPEQAEESASNPDRPPMHTLEQTMEMLNHTGRTIDIFKIDCEGCEWIVYPQLLQSPSLLRQILVETHKTHPQKTTDFFYSLHDAGYVIFSKEANFLWQGNGAEFSFLKLHTNFFINNSLYSIYQQELWNRTTGNKAKTSFLGHL